MTLSQFKAHLAAREAVSFLQTDGQPVPPHFHVTEMGLVTKDFIDCGGTVRSERAVTFQLWVADDTDHRLVSPKLLGIIAMGERIFGSDDLEVEVEYQGDTIGRYGLDFAGGHFQLTAKQTDCLAKEQCGVPELAEVGAFFSLTQSTAGACKPGSGCC